MTLVSDPVPFMCLLNIVGERSSKRKCRNLAEEVWLRYTAWRDGKGGRNGHAVQVAVVFKMEHEDDWSNIDLIHDP